MEKLKLKVIKDVYIRKNKPDSKSPDNIKGIIYKDQIIEINVEIIENESCEEIEGIRKWYKDANGDYMWSGGFETYTESNIKPELNLTTSNDLPWWIKDFGIDRIWNKTKGEGNHIILIDSGVKQNDPINKSVESYHISTFNDSIDNVGHGSLMKTIIHGDDYNQYGVSPLSDISTVKITNNKEINIKNFIDGLKLAKSLLRKDQPNIINLSLALKFNLTKSEKNQITESINDLCDLPNVFVIAAVGNDGERIKLLPSSHENVISVGGLLKISKNKVIPLSSSNIWDGINIHCPGDFQSMKVSNKMRYYLQGSSIACAFATSLISLFVSYSSFKKRNTDLKSIKEFLVNSSFSYSKHNYQLRILETNRLLEQFNI